MNENKNLIIAFFLIGIVLVISQMTIWKKPIQPVIKKEQSISQQKDDLVATKQDTLANIENKQVILTNDDSLYNKVDLTPITVTTDLYSMTISPLNFRITSFILTKYKKQKGEILDLVNDELGLENLLKLSTGTNKNYNMFFEVNKKNIILTTNHNKDSLEFVFKKNDVILVKKVIIFNNQNYFFDIKMDINKKDIPQYRSYELCWYNDISYSENEKDDNAYFRGIAEIGTDIVEHPIKDFKKKEVIKENGDIIWAGIRKKYFGIFFIFDKPHLEEVVFNGNYKDKELDFRISIPEYVTKLRYKVYMGPLSRKDMLLAGNGLEKASESGWHWIRFLSRIILLILSSVYKIVPNYGIAIIILAFLMKVAFYPFNQKTMASSEMMKQIQPKISAIKAKYPDDPKKQQMEIMKIYNEFGVNPLGGCLPMLIQMPVFFALYPVLKSYIELRGAYFFGWLTDLSLKDPYYILPILMGAAMFIQQKMTITDPKQKSMLYIMPIFLTFVFKNLPAGLVLYWFSYNVFSIIHQYYFLKKFDPEKFIKSKKG